MNMVIRGLGFDFGKSHADSFLNDQHPDLRADFVMANPPFNLKDWGGEQLQDGSRWVYGTPPAGNANFAWMQHMLYHLAAGGSMALLLANGSMSSNTNNEDVIRRNLLDADNVEVIVALPGQRFTNTQIPACIWFLRKDDKPRPNEVLFIDARQMGYMKDRVLRDFTNEDIARIAATTVHTPVDSSPSSKSTITLQPAAPKNSLPNLRTKSSVCFIKVAAKPNPVLSPSNVSLASGCPVRILTSKKTMSDRLR